MPSVSLPLVKMTHLMQPPRACVGLGGRLQNRPMMSHQRKTCAFLFCPVVSSLTDLTVIGFYSLHLAHQSVLEGRPFVSRFLWSSPSHKTHFFHREEGAAGCPANRPVIPADHISIHSPGRAETESRCCVHPQSRLQAYCAG